MIIENIDAMGRACGELSHTLMQAEGICEQYSAARNYAGKHGEDIPLNLQGVALTELADLVTIFNAGVDVVRGIYIAPEPVG